jgi:hypothetical protein
MKIALDWDGTFTRDPNLWYHFMGMCKAMGHDIRIVTLRTPAMAIDWGNELLPAYRIPVIYTSNVQKREYCDSIDWHPDIWIDDSPEFIVRRDFHTFLDVFGAVKEEI